MKNIITSITVFAVLISISAVSVCAENVSDSSATIKKAAELEAFDYRVENLRNFLEKYNSPLTSYADEFVQYADENDLDYRLVPAISGVESTFGKRIPVDSFNAYGWANGEYTFESWEDSISHVSLVLKNKYIDKGAVSINQIAKIYAPPSSTWGKNVSFFVRKIDILPLNFDII